ncbi:MFS transporter [Actinophytocola oryzae]|uniref:Fucose permease n=1 Tax=Actinophytocola oryzae TaxID=502181 RepID=A0A4V3FUS0_9PSEU|nr:MFS transporter [Actinophytocola oryzae]TDV56311.1 fucose permease [Actinophytocola oryzae]
MRGRTGGVLGLLAVAATWGVFWGGWAALIPDLKDALELDTRGLGLSLFAVPVAAVPAMVFTGRLADRFAQHTLPAATVVFAAGITLTAFTTSVPLFVVALLLVGAGSGGIEVALNATTAAHEARDGVRLFNKVHAATPLAMVLAGPAAGLARQLDVSRQVVLFVVAALVLVSAALAVDRRGWQGADAPDETALPVTGSRWLRPLLWVGAVAATVLLMENAVEQWGAVHLQQDLGTGPLLGSAGPAAYMAGLSAGRMLAQWRGDRFAEATLVRIGAVVGGCGLAVGAFAGLPVLTLAGFALAGIGLAPMVPTLLAAVGRSVEPGRRSTAISVVTTTAYAGFLASPPLVGLLAAGIGLPPALGVVAALGLVVLLGAQVLRLLPQPDLHPAEVTPPTLS